MNQLKYLKTYVSPDTYVQSIKCIE